LPCEKVISWQLAVGSWQLAVGSWQLAVGSWQLAKNLVEIGFKCQVQRKRQNFSLFNPIESQALS
jgi:hypothetical protein